MPSVIDDVVEVIMIMNIFLLSVVLRYPLTHVVVGQMPVVAGR
jgi:hypothetical protein